MKITLKLFASLTDYLPLQTRAIRVPSARGYAFSIVTPGWQLKTPFVYRIGQKLRIPA
mgnify:CR=1 FL=1